MNRRLVALIRYLDHKWGDRPYVIDITGEMHESYMEGLHAAQKIDRVAAFAAIRRAVKLARTYEGAARFAPSPYDEEMLYRACGVRAAIRAAIGSEKT
jgi:hypothetical protein